MVKLVFCCRRRPELSLEEFHARWLEIHGPLVRKLREQLPMMKRYVQSHLIPGEASDALRSSRGASEPYDGITEVWWNSLEELVEGMSSPEGKVAHKRLLEDEKDFIDFENS